MTPSTSCVLDALSYLLVVGQIEPLLLTGSQGVGRPSQGLA